MTQDLPVRDVMTTRVVTVAPDQPIQDAMGALVEAEVDGAPVVVVGSGALWWSSTSMA